MHERAYQKPAMDTNELKQLPDFVISKYLGVNLNQPIYCLGHITTGNECKHREHMAENGKCYHNN